MQQPTTHQQKLFDEQVKLRGDNAVVVQTAPARPAPLPEETRRAALARLKAEGKRQTLRARYARLLWRAWAHGVIFERPAKGNPERTVDVKVRSLTDKEAAFILGCQYTTINGRRNELMGRDDDLPEYAACPVVEEHQARRSLVMDSGNEVTTFRVVPDLFTDLD